MMKTIDNLGDLNLPEKFINTMQTFLFKIATLSNVNRVSEVILFGSSAKGMTHNASDLDILVIDDQADDNDDLLFELYECAANSSDITPGNYVSIDIIAMPMRRLMEHRNRLGMVQQYILRDGVILDESLYKR